MAPGSSLPGDSLGKYAVVAKLGANTCGSGIDATNPWDFTAEMSKDGTTLYFANEDDSDKVSGGYDGTDETSATLVSAVTKNVNDANANLGTTCNLTLTTTYALTLGSTSPPSTLTGSASYAYSVATAISSNTDCTTQLSSAGGKYATLPCTVKYSLKATRQ
ncbi:MAG: hypothetical protein ABIQ16_00805 [Polyangiaceae bacterium]